MKIFDAGGIPVDVDKYGILTFVTYCAYQFMMGFCDVPLTALTFSLSLGILVCATMIIWNHTTIGGVPFYKVLFRGRDV